MEHIMEMMMAEMMGDESGSSRKRERKTAQQGGGSVKSIWHDKFSEGQANHRKGYDWMLDAYRLFVEDALEDGDLIGGYADKQMGMMKSCPEAKSLFKQFCSGACDAGLLPSWWDQSTMNTIAFAKEKGSNVPILAVPVDNSSIIKKWGRNSVMQMRVLAREAIGMDDNFTDEEDDEDYEWEEYEDWSDQFEEEEEPCIKPCAANNYFTNSFVEEIEEVPATTNGTSKDGDPHNIVYECSSGLGLTEGVLSVEQLKKIYLSRKKASKLKKEKNVKLNEERHQETIKKSDRKGAAKRDPTLTKSQQAEVERKRIMEELLAQETKKKVPKKAGSKKK
eukprot:Tbor_TRINITY_DN5090_c0_g1::TRINITY_DN5090_c0_g1_i1::g.14076::m.14076